MTDLRVSRVITHYENEALAIWNEKLTMSPPPEIPTQKTLADSEVFSTSLKGLHRKRNSEQRGNRG